MRYQSYFPEVGLVLIEIGSVEEGIYQVTAPAEAEETDLAYLAMTPWV